MKKLFFSLILLLFVSGLNSEKIVLKDGNIKIGEIIKNDSQKIYLSPSNSLILYVIKKEHILTVIKDNSDITKEFLDRETESSTDIDFNKYEEVEEFNINLIKKIVEIKSIDQKLISTQKKQYYRKKKGILIGFGLGYYNSFLKQKKKYYYLDSYTFEEEFTINNLAGVCTDFKIGFAPYKNLEIIYSSKLFFEFDRYTFINQGFSTICVSKYLASTSKSSNKILSSMYINLGFGISYLTVKTADSSSFINAIFNNLIAYIGIPNTTEIMPLKGLGYYFGVGYELSKHFRIEANFLMNNLKSIDYKIEKSKSQIFMITINTMLFKSKH